MAARPRLWDIFSTLLVIGVQSFGGGASTFFLMHQACIDHGWLDEDGFLRAWALAQIAPGINLLKLTILVGYRLRGWAGVFAGASGMLLPSALVTVLMTAGFSSIRGQPLVQAAMRGILPATIGLSLAMAFQMGLPLLGRAHREGFPRLAVQLAILLGAGLLMALNSVSPVLVLLLAGVAAVLLLAITPLKGQPLEKFSSGDKPSTGDFPAKEEES
jgi:chromate transporter